MLRAEVRGFGAREGLLPGGVFFSCVKLLAPDSGAPSRLSGPRFIEPPEPPVSTIALAYLSNRLTQSFRPITDFSLFHRHVEITPGCELVASLFDVVSLHVSYTCRLHHVIL